MTLSTNTWSNKVLKNVLFNDKKSSVITNQRSTVKKVRPCPAVIYVKKQTNTLTIFNTVCLWFYTFTVENSDPCFWSLLWLNLFSNP